MKFCHIKNKYLKFSIVITAMALIIGVGFREFSKNSLKKEVLIESSKLTEENELHSRYQILLEDLFDYRNKGILEENEKLIKGLYNTDKKTGLWAYEHELQKMKYLKNWSNKQGVTFKDIKTKVKIKKVKEKEENLYGIICTVSTEYKYSYENEPEVENTFRMGTYHYLNVNEKDDKYIITKEWYTDPFADSMHLDNINSEEIKKHILAQQTVELQLTEYQQKAVDYAHKYCGAAANEEHGLKFNPNYKDFNPDGGDCANFASQIMFESGRFKKNPTWNYEKGNGTKAWVNAQGFKNYMVYSGRGWLLAKGTFKEVYKKAYDLRPGDFVAYEKGGRITHVSTVTGLDSKGYPLVTCHNTDRLLVPWDLGWSNKDIKFHLIKISY